MTSLKSWQHSDSISKQGDFAILGVRHSTRILKIYNQSPIVPSPCNFQVRCLCLFSCILAPVGGHITQSPLCTGLAGSSTSMQLPGQSQSQLSWTRGCVVRYFPALFVREAWGCLRLPQQVILVPSPKQTLHDLEIPRSLACHYENSPACLQNRSFSYGNSSFLRRGLALLCSDAVTEHHRLDKEHMKEIDSLF